MSFTRRFCCDDETGETVTYAINNETGEPLINKIPELVYMPPASESEPEPRNIRVNFRRGYSTNTKKFRNLQANILAGSNTISYRLLLIPTMLFFPALLCAMLMILEIYLHVRCHKKNKCLKEGNMYYRSPFHAVTSTFCGACRESESACKVGQMQDKRRHRYDYFRGLAM
ncbi:uncharacterized protein LOC125491209 [Plutella xylostella]|uniref:uncharacterized protein LOC125491209 n=1 Tax=Plutella xylostella TaxID=51655 RepID=UPI0020323678|nr:uncharacterized protein LOC125491209 [Plutella xylostella]